MIDIRHKSNCCGCEACVQVCPTKCIDFVTDIQGFLYPIVNNNSCIDCGLCEKVCPVINRGVSSKTSPVTLYAVKSNDNTVREQSSSGGFFSLLADFVLAKDGIVYGAAFDDMFNVCHFRVDNIADLHKLRGSKYVQSRIGQTFSECQRDLKEGKLVLFTGTPCQISALGHFLRNDYDNLIKVEVVCHGVPSPMIYRQYLKETIINDGEDRAITKVNFRTKISSWKNYFFTVEYKELGGISEYKECVTDSLYMNGFLSDLYVRPSCFKCPAKNFTSKADFTIADFWGQEYTFPEFDDDQGVSAVFTNTAKAKYIFNQLSCIVMEKPYADFIKYNPSLINSVIQTYSYSKFWKLYNRTGELRTSIVKAREIPFYVRMFNNLKRIIR